MGLVPPGRTPLLLCNAQVCLYGHIPSCVKKKEKELKMVPRLDKHFKYVYLATYLPVLKKRERAKKRYLG